MWRRVAGLLPAAHLEALPTYGNRLNVLLAVVTTAAYQELLERGVSRDDAPTLVADLGWKVYARVFTHWTYCPPYPFVRSLVGSQEDRGKLEAFYRAWCLYEWRGADLLVGDGEHGHYARPHTLSRGDAVCCMCWSAWRMDAGGAGPVD